MTEGGAGLAAALETISPLVAHQRCWVHKLRNLWGRPGDGTTPRRKRMPRRSIKRRVGRRPSRASGGAPTALVTRLLQYLPEVLAFFQCPRAHWRKLRTTNMIVRCFVEVRRRTRPMVCFVNVQSIERIIFSIFNRFNLEWRQRTLPQFTQVA